MAAAELTWEKMAQARLNQREAAVAKKQANSSWYRFKQNFRDTHVGDWATQNFRNKLGKWWVYSWYTAVRTRGLIPTNPSLQGRSFAIPSPTGGMRKVKFTEVSQDGTDKLLKKWADAPSGSKERAIADAYSKYKHEVIEYNKHLEQVDQLAVAKNRVEFAYEDILKQADLVKGLSELSKLTKVNFTSKDAAVSDPTKSDSYKKIEDWLVQNEFNPDARKSKEFNENKDKYFGYLKQFRSLSPDQYKSIVNGLAGKGIVGSTFDSELKKIKKSYSDFQSQKSYNSLEQLVAAIRTSSIKQTFHPDDWSRLVSSPGGLVPESARFMQAARHIGLDQGPANRNRDFTNMPSIHFPTIPREFTNLPKEKAGPRASITVKYNGKHYVFGPGEQGTFGLFEEIPKARITDILSPKKMWHWREYWKTNYAHPPDELFKIHANLGENRLFAGMTAKEGFDKTVASFKTNMTAGAGTAMLSDMIMETVSKRFFNHGVNSISGRLYAQALADSTDVGQGAFSGESVASMTEEGELASRTNPLSIDKNAVYKLDELSPSDQLMVFRHIIMEALPSNSYVSARGLSPERVAKMKELSRDPDTRISKMAKRSLDDNFDWLNVFERSRMRAKRASGKEFVLNTPGVVVNPNGVADIGQLSVGAKGDIHTYMPVGYKPLVMSRWNYPTVGAYVIPRLLSLIPKYDQFVLPIVDQWKRRDTSLGELLLTERNMFKEKIGQLMHGGVLDDASDIPLKWAAITGMDISEANDMWLHVHEISKKIDGDRWDHIRRSLYNMLSNLDDDFKLEYGSAKDLVMDPQEQIKMMEQRGRLIRRLSSSKYVLTLGRQSALAAQSGDIENAENIRKKAIDWIQTKFSTDLMTSPFPELEKADRRATAVFDFIAENHEALAFLYNPYAEVERKHADIGGYSDLPAPGTRKEIITSPSVESRAQASPKMNPIRPRKKDDDDDDEK